MFILIIVLFVSMVSLYLTLVLSGRTKEHLLGGRTKEHVRVFAPNKRGGLLVPLSTLRYPERVRWRHHADRLLFIAVDWNLIRDVFDRTARN